MSEYTPTTGEIKAAWLDAHRIDAEGGGFEREGKPRERLAEFDRWLAEHDRQVAEAAWYEGICEAHGNLLSYEQVEMLNPYRKDA